MSTSKKRLLYIAPDHYSFYKTILEGFEKFSDYEVQFAFSNRAEGFKYKNFGQRVYNFFLKLLTGKNIKKIYEKEYFERKINEYEKYDIAYINRPDILTEKQLEEITNKCNKSIVYYWDSFEKIEGQFETMKYFDKVYSFDKYDCKKYGMIKGYNFFYNSDNSKEPEYDVFFLGTYDDRYNNLINILERISSQNLHAHATLFSYDKGLSKTVNHKNISFIHKIVPFNEAFIYNQNTTIILDIQHATQVGLSFRPYEALGLKKKLITTNPYIKEYDFYNPNNIFIWDENTESIPESFLQTPYEDIPEDIYNKYKLENWVKTILS
ncbi:lipopolysaccharide core biosynthesis protein rfaS [Flavobacterium sp. NRK F10]|uniref:lipopolysaccharide core biosynthesis protein rfaS n=1 Tax=Flavobacterium sp. NRK F10 TaxID=2954931 RepID=UPI002090C3B5|nr:lipopolysaccharide core biosynthesis protein rfaS [Flavobacterium sp. NRK F10]MCO6173810.1 lipopolysaccharide core biosynthesis protein rfaS [Flavobacterium sp. NRK F10]